MPNFLGELYHFRKGALVHPYSLQLLGNMLEWCYVCVV